MDQQRQKAIEELQISNNHAICQKCGLAVPLLNNVNTKPTGRRIETLRWRINWLRQHYHPESKSQKEEIKAMEAELAGLLADDAEYEKLRNIPLYSAKITGWKFVCSACYEKAYSRRRRN